MGKRNLGSFLLVIKERWDKEKKESGKKEEKRRKKGRRTGGRAEGRIRSGSGWFFEIHVKILQGQKAQMLAQTR